MHSQSVLCMTAIDGKSDFCNELYCIITILLHYYYNRFTAPWTLSGTTRVSWYQKGNTRKEQEIVSGSDISWAICKSAPCPRQITTPASHHSTFYRPDALPATQPTASKYWRCLYCHNSKNKWQFCQFILFCTSLNTCLLFRSHS